MNDPVKGCAVYRNIGCSHVDGFLCDYPNCSIMKDYMMNERIRELYLEAAKWADQQDEDLIAKLLIRDEKFAELMIQECIDVCKSRVGNSDYNTGRMHCASDLKEHFGVE